MWQDAIYPQKPTTGNDRETCPSSFDSSYTMSDWAQNHEISPQFQRYRDKILIGVDKVQQLGCPGGLNIIGPNAFCLLSTPTAPRTCVAAAAEFGQGRMVAIAHDGYLREWEDRSFSSFIRQCIDWVGQRPGAPYKRNCLLKDHVALFNRAESCNPEEVISFVECGGGAVFAMCPWGWKQIHGRSLVSDFSFNQAIIPMGLQFIDGCFEGNQGYYHAQTSNLVECNGWLCLQYLKNGDEYSFAERKLGLAPSSVKASSSPLVEAQAALGGPGGWWAPVGSDHWIELEWDKNVRMSSLEIHCVNVNACPTTIELHNVSSPSSLLTTAPTSLEFVQEWQFPVQDASRPRAPVSLGLLIPLVTTRIRITLRGVHNSHYIGVNSIAVTHLARHIRGGHCIASLLTLRDYRCVTLSTSPPRMPLIDVDEVIECIRDRVEDELNGAFPLESDPLCISSDLRCLVSAFWEHYNPSSHAHGTPAAINVGSTSHTVRHRVAQNPLATPMQHFPGIVPDTVVRETVDLLVQIPAGGGGWVSTHTYASAGDVIVIDVQQQAGIEMEGDAAASGWSVQVGCHTGICPHSSKSHFSHIISRPC